MMKRWAGLFFLLILALPAAGFRADKYTVQSAGACTDPTVSDAVKKSLQEQGLSISGANGPLCEIWLRKVLPQGSGTGTDYSTMAPGTFVGVIRYSRAAGDYKGQTIKPGIYAMYYQTMPSDGNHMGVAPSPDFFVLLPAGTAKDPDTTIGFQDLIKLGKQASGISHINPLYLPEPSGGSRPEMKALDDGQWALEAQTKAQPKGGPAIDFPVAIVLVGRSEG